MGATYSFVLEGKEKDKNKKTGYQIEKEKTRNSELEVIKTMLENRDTLLTEIEEHKTKIEEQRRQLKKMKEEYVIKAQEKVKELNLQQHFDDFNKTEKYVIDFCDKILSECGLAYAIEREGSGL